MAFFCEKIPSKILDIAAVTRMPSVRAPIPDHILSSFFWLSLTASAATATGWYT